MPTDLYTRLRKENEATNVTLRRLQVSSQRAEIAGAFPRLNFADLPTPGKEGRVIYVKDGQKQGEGSGAGTGVGAYDDGSAWRRFCDDTTVTASGSAIDYVILSPATSARNVVQPTGAAVIPLIIRAFAGQTANLFEIQDSTSSILTSINASGEYSSIHKVQNSTTPCELRIGNSVFGTTSQNHVKFYHNVNGREPGDAWRIIDDITAGGSLATHYQIGDLVFQGRAAVTDATLTDYVYFKSSGRVGIRVLSPDSQVHIDQPSTTAAIPVLHLDQGDVDQPFIKFSGGTIYTTLSGQDEYLKVIDPNGNTRYLRLFA